MLSFCKNIGMIKADALTYPECRMVDCSAFTTMPNLSTTERATLSNVVIK